MLISEIGEEEDLITHPRMEAKIECKNDSNSLLEDKSPDIGSIRLKLSCSCKLILSDDVLIPTRYPCQEYPAEIETTYIIPAT